VEGNPRDQPSQQTSRQADKETSKTHLLKMMARFLHSYLSAKTMLKTVTRCLDLYEIQTGIHSIRIHMQHLLMILAMKCTYASVASSSSGSDDAGDQPSFTKLTRLPDTGMRQRWTSTDTQSNKQDRTPKTKRTSKGQAITTPSTMASIARNVCTDILSPIVGNMYVYWNRKVRCLSIELRTGIPLHLFIYP